MLYYVYRRESGFLWYEFKWKEENIMLRLKIKEELMIVVKDNYEKLNILILKMFVEELNILFDFLMDEKKKEVYWKRDKNLRDILIYFYEWY